MLANTEPLFPRSKLTTRGAPGWDLQMAVSMAFEDLEAAGTDETKWRTAMLTLVYRMEFALLEVPFRMLYCDLMPAPRSLWRWSAPWLSLDNVAEDGWHLGVAGGWRFVIPADMATAVLVADPHPPASNIMERMPLAEVVLHTRASDLLLYAMWQRYSGPTTAVRVTLVVRRVPVQVVSAVLRVPASASKWWRRWFRQLQHAPTVREVQPLLQGKVWSGAVVSRWLQGDSIQVTDTEPMPVGVNQA